MSSADHVFETDPAAATAEQVTFDGSAGIDSNGEEHAILIPAPRDDSDVQHHARSNSVKKPATFKAVSVTKNFLAKAGAPTTSGLKINGDNVASTPNGTGPTLPVPRPRLVAKLASATKPDKAQFAAKDGAPGPDPMQVWNRNRAAPQQAQKHLTDEELKQQYGIHLATRIQADGDGKEAKWADIDDDEDDWAPETIEWNDGTKITLPQHDPAAILAEEQAAAEAARIKEEELRKAKAAAQAKVVTTVGPNATVLKPRSAIQPKAGSTLSLKAPVEKPTLVSKPVTATPTKSPWAALPVIDKVPPVEISPPIQTSTSRAPENIDHLSQQTRIQPHQALEIAADSFKRNPREFNNEGAGQLFNAQSGKYEPAITGRRGSVRKEGNFRPPSLLQRTGTGQDTAHANESSPFARSRRLSRGETQQPPRRQSSTVSGESGPLGRRASISKGNEAAYNRRGSHTSQAVQSPSTSAYGQSPALQHSQLASELHSGAKPYVAADGSAASPAERQDVLQQKQLMKEKREIALRRRKEEEEREELEKKERIRKKLEGLGPDPLPSKKDAEAKEHPSISIEQRPVSATSNGANNLRPGQKDLEKQRLPNPTATTNSSGTSIRSPPKPPAPSASGVPQQYGMMKVHGPSHRDTLQQINNTLNLERSKEQAQKQRITQTLEGTQVTTIGTGNDGPESLTLAHMPQSKGSLAPHENDIPQEGQEARKQAWMNNSREQYNAWNAQGVPRESNSVWGTSSQTKALGNGTFDRTVQRPQTKQHEQFVPPALAPIGPPRQSQPPKDLRDVSQLHHSGPAYSLENQQTIPSFPLSDSIGKGVAVDFATRTPNGDTTAIPSAYNDAVNGTYPHHSDEQQPGSKMKAWNNFHENAKNDELTLHHHVRTQEDARVAEEARTGLRREAQLPIINETWRQVRVDDHGPGRTVTGVSRSQTTSNSNSVSNSVSESRGPMLLTASMDGVTAPAANHSRLSRFFPKPHPYAHLQPDYIQQQSRKESPPPLDSSLHLAKSGEREHVVVRLPMADGIQKPTVRLPPAASIPSGSSILEAARPAASRNLDNAAEKSSWQDKFNGLLGVKKATQSDKSHERKIAHVAEFSATKEALRMAAPSPYAAVTLPPQAEDAFESAIDAASRNPADEDALFEPESGSTPTVQFPVGHAKPAWGVRTFNKPHQMRPLASSPAVQASTAELLHLPAFFTHDNMLLVFINILGMASSKSKSMKLPGGYQNIRETSIMPKLPAPSKGTKPLAKGYNGKETLNSSQQSPNAAQNGGRQRGPSVGSSRAHQQRGHSASSRVIANRA